jgi:hypothetical protein
MPRASFVEILPEWCLWYTRCTTLSMSTPVTIYVPVLNAAADAGRDPWPRAAPVGPGCGPTIGNSAALDAGMISSAQAVEHYEIAQRGTLSRRQNGSA